MNKTNKIKMIEKLLNELRLAGEHDEWQLDGQASRNSSKIQSLFIFFFKKVIYSRKVTIRNQFRVAGESHRDASCIN